MSAESGEEDYNSKMQECSHCSKTFRYKSERIRHEMSHSASFECETCSKKFSFISALRRHEKQHKRKERVKCEKCNKWFRDRELLKRHINYSHKVSLPCPECSTVFHSEQALQTHLKIHKPISERRYRCTFPDCGKSFNFSHHLKHHVLTHINAKQHYCDICWKGFIQYHHLKEHMKSHDQAESLRCDFPGCGKTYSTEYARKRHRLSHKIKRDSGISSDSNSCDASTSHKEYSKDYVLCSTCGENLPPSDFLEHSNSCGDRLTSSDNKFYDIPSLKEEIIFDETKLKISDYEPDLDGCKSAIGACIMGANSCVCDQIPKSNHESYDLAPIDNQNSTNNVYVDRNNHIKSSNSNKNEDFMDRYLDIVTSFMDSQGNDIVYKTELDDLAMPKKPININNSSNMCENCACASICNIRQPLNCIGNKNISKNDNVPNVEYSIDGVVKIKDTFDIDIIPIKVENKHEIIVNDKSEKIVPFGTCKDVIGNCISEEGCLCARMMMDEQQEMAQEIDDITPIPKTDCVTSVPI